VAVENGIKAAILANFCASTNEYSTTYERTLIAETPEKNLSTATPDYNSLGVSTLEHSHDCRGSTTPSSKTETPVER
jgi:hypothetical protein